MLEFRVRVNLPASVYHFAMLARDSEEEKRENGRIYLIDVGEGV